MTEPILCVQDLVKHYPTETGLLSRGSKVVHAVDGISFEIMKSETMGLVGESGCGKTTTGRCIARLINPTSGSIFWKGNDVLRYRADHLRTIRREIQMVFQDPYSSLTPTMTVETLLEEPIRIHKIVRNNEEVEQQIDNLLTRVDLRPGVFRRRYPHELSGGERQRVVIARALSLRPQLVLLDEPVAALDVSVQANIVNLLKDLQGDLGLTFLLISHDLNLVRYMSRRIAVMYLGKIVEYASAQELFSKPAHPYTTALLSAAPVADPAVQRKRIILQGEVPSPVNPPEGCRFSPRCANSRPICLKEVPRLTEISPNHYVACYSEP